MFIQPLASGSKGNLTWLENDGTAILIDAGLSAKQCEKRIFDAGKDIRSVSAILISHEHSDHIKGLRVLANRYGIRVYLNQKTAAAALDRGFLEDLQNVQIFENGRSFTLEKMIIHPFPVSHDAADTVNYVIRSESASFGIFTDLGYVSSLVRVKSMGLDSMILEANHDVEMLKKSRYPLEVKRRIRSRQGHLSNDESLALMDDIIQNGRLKKVWFGHLSEENNDPHLLTEQFFKTIPAANTLKMEIALQDQVSESFSL
jgi:phosphoribosyl 1,2-cyclic phosphodiesterase